jgi:hypothetical protein
MFFPLLGKCRGKNVLLQVVLDVFINGGVCCKLEESMEMRNKLTANIIGKMVLLVAVVFSLPVRGQSFSISYTTFADSLDEVPLEAVIDYDIIDPERQLVAITGFSGSFSDLAIPGTVVYDSLEYKVTEIGEAAFASREEEQTEHTYLGSLFLPEGMTVIGNFAFENAEFNIRMPDGVVEIRQGAFAGCRDLILDKLPDKLELIGSDAFRRSGVTDTIHIPLSVWELGSGAFAECEALQGFSVDPDNQLFSVSDGILFDGDGGHLIQYPGGKADSSFVVPQEVTDVEDAGFAGCNYLQSVSFSNESTSLWREAFLNCKGLETVTLPQKMDNIADRVFAGCSSLREIIIPGQVTSIGKEAFLDCSSLGSITIPENVMFLGERSFWGCDGVEWVKAFPKQPPMMENDVFSKNNIPVYSHFSSIDSYRLSEQWSLFATYIPMAEVYVEDLSVYPMGNKQFDLVLETAGWEDSLFDTIEFTLSLPAGLSLDADSITGSSWVVPEEQPNGNLHVEMTDDKEGNYHFLVRTEEGANIISGHYPLLTLRLCADSQVEDIDLSASVTEAQFKSADLLVADLPSCSFSVLVERLLDGDVNYDSRQNVVDVMFIVNYILDNQVPIPVAVADINHDSIVDIVDVMRLVQLILWND